MSTQCPSCGNVNRSTEPRCLRCGNYFTQAQTPLPPAKLNNKRRNWLIAIACLIFLGFIGSLAEKKDRPNQTSRPSAAVESLSPSPTPYATPRPTAYGLTSKPSQPTARPRPAPQRSAPAGASAICRDGTYSYSQNRRGTCSHHGGVAQWL
jgi:hypothetical protein